MKKIVILFLLFPNLLFAQLNIAGKIIDSKTKQPIPFVNLENFRTKTGTQTNQDGVFSLNLPNCNRTDTLKISCVGYADKYFTNLTSADELIYELTPVVFLLNEVKVGKNRRKEIEIGIITKSGHIWEMLNRERQKPGLQRAVYMKNQNYGIAYLSTLSFLWAMICLMLLLGLGFTKTIMVFQERMLLIKVLNLQQQRKIHGIHLVLQNIIFCCPIMVYGLLWNGLRMKNMQKLQIIILDNPMAPKRFVASTIMGQK
jgi:hypothetical protein